MVSSSSSSSPSSASSPSSSAASRPAYSTANSEWIKVLPWRNGIVAGRTIAQIKYKKLATGVNHEYLLFTNPDNTLFVTERGDENPPDVTITMAREANDLLTTLTPSLQHTLPELTFARILVLVGNKAPTYSWSKNNCYWYAGSVSETIRVGLQGVTENRTGEYKNRGKFKTWIKNFSVGDSPTTVPIPVFASIAHPVQPPVAPQLEVWDEQPYKQVIKEFGQTDNLTAYEKVHLKNIGPLQVDFENDLEKQLTIALRGLVGYILRDLAHPLKPEDKNFEDLPALKKWLEQDRALA